MNAAQRGEEGLSEAAAEVEAEAVAGKTADKEVVVQAVDQIHAASRLMI